MTNLLIQSWQKYNPLTSPQDLTREVLLGRLQPVADLTNAALMRLVLRLRARCPISLPLRADADVPSLVSWFTQAGAVVAVSTASGNPTAQVR